MTHYLAVSYQTDYTKKINIFIDAQSVLLQCYKVGRGDRGVGNEVGGKTTVWATTVWVGIQRGQGDDVKRGHGWGYDKGQGNDVDKGVGNNEGWEMRAWATTWAGRQGRCGRWDMGDNVGWGVGMNNIDSEMRATYSEKRAMTWARRQEGVGDDAL
jgi:hypothetical protein